MMIDNIKCLYMLYNILQMLEDRKYTYLGMNYEKIKKDKNKIDNDINLEIDDYTYILKKYKYNIIAKKDNSYIFILFLESFNELKYNIDINYIYKNISNYVIKHHYWEKIKNAYIVCPDEYGDQITKKLNKEQLFVIEIIKYTKLLYNPTKNIYFPKHEKIKNYEQKYKKYNIKLPIILKNDIASRWYNYSLNDIIKITRNDKSICYRIVKDENMENQEF